MRFVKIVLACVKAAIFFQVSSATTLSRHEISPRAEPFSCPSPMKYSPWIKACSCPPGQSWNAKKKKCAGTKLVGSWPEPETARFRSATDIELSSFCASSPVRIVPFDPSHEYCRVGVNTLAFVAASSIIPELEGLDVVDYEDPNISDALKTVGAGLSGLYLADVNDAVALFNTNKFGLGTLIRNLLGSLPSGIIDLVDNILCLLKPRDSGGDDDEDCSHGCDDDEDEDEDDECNHDCVAFATKGCGNVLDGIVGGIGGLLEGLSGLCVLDGVLELVGEGGELAGSVVDDLLCTVGNVLGGLLDLFDCDCEK